MEKKKETTNLVSAINQVMAEVKGIEKTLNVGTGNSSYKGVSDQEVKKTIGRAMERAGLAIVPIDIDANHNVERWTEKTNYNNQPGERTRTQVFTDVKVKYKLLHVSGQSIDLVGYGHGVDSMDKSAGKATTYALKYALLYLFLVPTGTIDDADKTDPNGEPLQPKKQTLTDKQFTKGVAAINANTYSVEEMKAEFQLSEPQLKELDELN